jgi:hypothetical protein
MGPIIDNILNMTDEEFLLLHKKCYRFIIFHNYGRFIHKVTFSSITRFLIHKSFGGISGGSQRMA